MRNIIFVMVLLLGCGSVFADDGSSSNQMSSTGEETLSSYRAEIAADEPPIPTQIAPGERRVLVDPNVGAWGAYDASGRLIRWGDASAGSNWCPDLGRKCHTRSGEFRVFSKGGPGCVSSKFPIPRGGAPMPYCMFFSGGLALHGSYDVPNYNASHGCVRVPVEDAQWLSANFVGIGTKVIVKPY